LAEEEPTPRGSDLTITGEHWSSSLGFEYFGLLGCPYVNHNNLCGEKSDKQDPTEALKQWQEAAFSKQAGMIIRSITILPAKRTPGGRQTSSWPHAGSIAPLPLAGWWSLPAVLVD
jgi:hypothetical protein